jgi:hypothetical protein
MNIERLAHITISKQNFITYEEILARTRALVPAIRERVAETESVRQQLDEAAIS